MIDPDLRKILNGMARKLREVQGQYAELFSRYDELVRVAAQEPRTITEEIDATPGRRIFYNLTKRQSFTIAQNGLRGNPLTYTLSQDGAFIATHYPMVMWKPNAPANATNFGRWSPVGSWPLPTQQITAFDIIDLSYEVVDSGSQRNFQNEASGPVFSRPDNLVPLPVPTLFSPASVIQFFPTFERIFFAAQQQGDIATTGGQLVVTFPGYRVVNQ